jgi:hypothetical protein
MLLISKPIEINAYYSTVLNDSIVGTLGEFTRETNSWKLLLAFIPNVLYDFRPNRLN